jgi:DNA-binding NarL/FixJ family response regulator/REP element-mobilizing transposase RayT
MSTQVLIIHGQLPFAIKLKQTLERNASFEVHPFTSFDAAVDYLSEHVQDVTLVDFSLPGFTGEQMVRQLRIIQPGIPVIATPKIDDVDMHDLDVIAALDKNFQARDLINTINNFFSRNERPTSYAAATTNELPREQQKPPKRSAPLPPADIPEYTSLDSVLSSAGTANIFEPPRKEGDTPAGMIAELNWADDLAKPGASFDDVLSALPEDADVNESSSSRNPFTDLVNSMKSEEAHRPLPSRQQQFVEYILTGELDPLIEDMPSEPPEPVLPPPGTPPPPKKITSLFDRLSKDEPPPPSFEESGTVSDLVTGVQDRSFRNVLSILRGEEEEAEEAEPEIAPPTAADFDVGSRSTSGISPLEEVEGFDFGDEPTPAKVILQRTLEQSMSGGGFTLEELLASIDQQLPLHRPKVQPLPSWLREQRRSEEDSFLVREPDFLPEQLPDEPTPVEPSELYADQITLPARGQVIEAHPEALETEWLQSPERFSEETISFPESLPEEYPADETIVHRRAVEEALGDFSYEDAQAFEELAEAQYEDDFQAVEPIEADEETPAHADAYDSAQVYSGPEALEYADTFDYAQPMEPVGAEAGATTGAWYDLPEQDFNTQFEMMAAFQVLGEDGVSKGALYTEVPVEPQPPEASPVAEPEPQPAASAEDPYLAQLALSLTEVSLELTAEATLLARDQQIVAYAGRMDAEEVEELRGTIADDWDAAPGEVRIRFITAQGSGKDYMLYSRRTEDDFTLSLVFAGTTPLRDIRRQGKRLVDALLSVPEAPPAPKPITAPVVPVKVEPLDVGARTPYAYVWLLRDPRAHLDSAVSQAIISGLNVQMREKQWAIQTLQVHEDYVYMLADVPGEELPYQTVRELKRRSAEIAHAQNPAYAPERLWANSYLVVTPGRELDQEEIQQFINFDRM